MAAHLDMIDQTTNRAIVSAFLTGLRSMSDDVRRAIVGPAAAERIESGGETLTDVVLAATRLGVQPAILFAEVRYATEGAGH